MLAFNNKKIMEKKVQGISGGGYPCGRLLKGVVAMAALVDPGAHAGNLRGNVEGLTTNPPVIGDYDRFGDYDENGNDPKAVSVAYQNVLKLTGAKDALERQLAADTTTNTTTPTPPPTPAPFKTRWTALEGVYNSTFKKVLEQRTSEDKGFLSDKELEPVKTAMFKAVSDKSVTGKVGENSAWDLQFKSYDPESRGWPVKAGQRALPLIQDVTKGMSRVKKALVGQFLAELLKELIKNKEVKAVIEVQPRTTPAPVPTQDPAIKELTDAVKGLNNKTAGLKNATAALQNETDTLKAGAKETAKLIELQAKDAEKLQDGGPSRRLEEHLEV